MFRSSLVLLRREILTRKSLRQIGLSFSGLLVGQLAAIATDSLWHNNYLRLIRNHEEKEGEAGGSEPEYRLPPAIAGGILVPIGLFWYLCSIAVFTMANRELTSA